MAACKKNAGYSCSNPSDCSKKGCRVDRDYNGVNDMNEIWSGKKQWRKEARYENPSSDSDTSSSSRKKDGPGFWGWVGIVIFALLVLPQACGG